MEKEDENIGELKKKGFWYAKNIELEKGVEKDVCSLVSSKFAIEFRIIPIFSDIDDYENIHITCITSRYSNLQKLQMFKEALNAKINLLFCTEENIIKGLAKFYGISSEQIQLSGLQSLHLEDEEDGNSSEDTSIDANDPKGAQTKFKKIYRDIMDTAISLHASDIHLMHMEQRLQVIFRINGKRVDFTDKFHIEARIQHRITNILKQSCNPTMEESEEINQDGKITYRYVDGNEIRDIYCRVNAIPIGFGQKLAIRIIDTKATVPEMPSLGYTEKEMQLITKAALKSQGIFILAGPTGSGKSTSLAAIDALFSPIQYHKIHICDPIEYRDDRITQVSIREIGSADDITFDSVLPNLVRQDPDNLLIGEIRDRKSAVAAMNYAATGHRVSTSIHAADILSIFDRLEFIGLQRYAILSQTNALMAQRLLPLSCEECKEEYTPDKIYKNQFKDQFDIKNISKFYRGKGCPKCNYSGISRRIAIGEILILDYAVKDMLKRDLGMVETKRRLKEEYGFISIAEKIYKYLESGQVALEPLIDLIPGE